MESTAKLLEDSLLIIWNDRDAQRRITAMKDIYASGIVFYESNDGPAITGHEAINDTIAKLQSGWPPEFTFTVTHPATVNHNVQHIAWTLGASSQQPAASGMDIAIIEEGKIKSLHLFLNAPAQ